MHYHKIIIANLTAPITSQIYERVTFSELHRTMDLNGFCVSPFPRLKKRKKRKKKRKRNLKNFKYSTTLPYWFIERNVTIRGIFHTEVYIHLTIILSRISIETRLRSSTIHFGRSEVKSSVISRESKTFIFKFVEYKSLTVFIDRNPLSSIEAWFFMPRRRLWSTKRVRTKAIERDEEGSFFSSKGTSLTIEQY